MSVVYHFILYFTLTHYLLPLTHYLLSCLFGMKKIKIKIEFSEIPKFTVEYHLQQLLSAVSLALPLCLCYVMGIFIPIE